MYMNLETALGWVISVFYLIYDVQISVLPAFLTRF